MIPAFRRPDGRPRGINGAWADVPLIMLAVLILIPLFVQLGGIVWRFLADR